MIFFTTGEKIRSLRKKFGMRQQELEDENITRAFISMIETGKRGLSRETARHIAQKINIKAQSLGMSFSIDEAYLMRTPAEDAEFYCLQKLNNAPTKDEIDVIIDVAKNHSLTKIEAKAHKILGDYDFEGEYYGSAFIKYMLSLDLYKDTDERCSIAYLYNRLGVCKTKQQDYIEAYSFFSRANHYAALYKDSLIEKHVIFNMADVLKELGRYDEALEYIQRYLEFCSIEEDFNSYAYASVIKAECYIYKNNKEKAIFILNETIDKQPEANNESIWKVYNSIGAIYLDENSLERSLECFDIAEKIAEKSCIKNLSKTYIQKASVLIRMGLMDEALKLAVKGLKSAQEANDILTLINAYNKLIDIYVKLSDFNNLKGSYIKLIDIMKDKEAYRGEVSRLYNRLALLYLEQNDIEMCKKYLKMAS
jgi:HTH-type transcriptional regulator, quorum sensing regulator NprR